MKRITAILLAVLMLPALIACGTRSTDSISISGDSVTVGDLALRPDGEAGKLYENDGLKLLVPLEYDELLQVTVTEDAEDGALFAVTEKASMEAARASDYEDAGAGWLFTIARVDEGARQSLLCYTDLSGVEIFAKDAEGMYYVLRTPTDVRYVREDNEAMERDQEIWTALCAWAYGSVRDTFLTENPDLTAVKQGSTALDLSLARIAYMPGEAYTVSTTQFGPLAPADGFDCAPWLEPLMAGVFEPVEGEAPDGEYVVLELPEEGMRFDFFTADKNCIRQVSGEWEQLFKAGFEDESVNATDLMLAWYDALAEDQGLAPESGLLGGWTLEGSIEITEAAQAAFDKAMEGLVGVKYTPVALLGTQLVSGTNYCFLCEAAVAYPNAQPYYAVVTVCQDLQGKAEIRNIVSLDLGSIAESGEIRDVQPQGGQVLGGWTVDRESSVEAENAVLHLASQLVSGTNHCVLSRGWTLDFIYEDLQGKAELSRSVPLDIAALSQPVE